MRQTDIFILEHLYNNGDALIDSPADIAANIGYAAGNVRQRLPILRRAGLVEYHDQDAGQYQLADLGVKYIEGRLEDDEIDALEAALTS